MGKKKKKKRIGEESVKIESKKISVSKKIEDILNHRWIPVIIFLLLSVIYFNKLIFQPVVLVSTEGGPVGYGNSGGSLQYFENPFKEGAVWENLLMGGHPKAQALMDYTIRIFTNTALIFFKDYKDIAMWVVFLTFCAGLFMFLYMRVMGLRNSNALIIGVAYMFAPMFMSLTYAMHYSKMGVMAILPLIFLNIEKGMNEGKFRYFLYLGGCIALAIGTAHLQFAYFSILASGFYFIFKLIIKIKNKENFKLIIRKILLYGFAIMIGFGLSARSFLPQYLHTSTVSKRAYTIVEGKKETGVGLQTGASWSLHPEEIMSLLIPEFGNYKEFYWGRNPFKLNSEYFGSIIILLSIISLVFLRKNKNILFFLLLFIFSIIFALGLHTPFYTLFYYILPGMKRLRGPGMIMFLSYFSAMVMAGLALEYLVSKLKEGEEKFKITYMILGIVGFISLLFIVFPKGIISIWNGIFYSNIPQQRLDVMNLNLHNITKGSFILLINILALFICVYLYWKKRLGAEIFSLILIPMIVIDTWRIDKDFLATIPLENARQYEKQQQNIEAYEFIKQYDKTVFRVFPDHVFQNDGPFNRFSYPGINMVTGFIDFTLWRYNNLMQQNLNSTSLNLLNVKYIVSVRDFPQGPFEQVYSKDGVRVYLNKGVLPFYYVRKNWIVEKDENKVFSMVDGGAVNLYNTAVIEKEPPKEYQNINRDDSLGVVFLNEDKYYSKVSEFNFKIKSSSPGILIVSDNYHPDWHCYVDGKEVEVYQVNYLWKGGFFLAGEHQVDFRFIAKDIILSRRIMFSSMGLFLIMFLFISENDYNLFTRLKNKIRKR